MTNDAMKQTTGWLCPLYAFDCYSDVNLSQGISLKKAPRKLNEYIYQQTRHMYGLWSDLSDFTMALCFTNTNLDVKKKKSANSEDEIITQFRDVYKEHDRINDLVFDVVTALRLCHAGYIHVGPLVLFQHDSTGWSVGGSVIWAGVSEKNIRIENPAYSLQKGDVSDINKHLLSIKILRQCKLLNSLNIAIERFHSSYSGPIQDRLIDQMIGLESLYMSDDKELKYKLALRAAFFIGDEDSRETIFDNIKLAYDIRSSIVHGSRSKKLDKLDEITPTLEEYLRQSILRISILLAKENSLSTIKEKLLDKNIFASGKLLQ